jgi:SAM-dependent methyltransferase
MSGAPKIFAPEYYARMRALEEGAWWNAAMRGVAGRLLARAGLAREGVMLDVGCGSGQSMRWFRSIRPGWRTIGFDVSRDGLRAARQGGGETVVAASALRIPLPSRSVDAVVTLDVLQHLPLGGGDATALSEIWRVLRSGGVVLVRTNAQAIPHTPDDPRHDFHKYTGQELRRKLEAAGFDVVVLGRLNSLLGLAEIPRELRARRADGAGYHGLLSPVPRRGSAWRLKHAWLSLEGTLAARGVALPLGRTLLALGRAREGCTA